MDGAAAALGAGRIRALRGPKGDVDPWAEPAFTLERERRFGGGSRAALTVFLAGAECPYTCVFCDLWRHTLDGPTPVGALPEQLRQVLARQGDAAREPGACLKLYNASNFFDPRAVPPADDEALARLADGFDEVVVESHPKLVGARCRDFARRLEGRLQVAMGFENLHPRALPRLGKGATAGDLAAAAGRLRDYGAGLRAFVLVGAPYVPAAERLSSVAETVGFALELGAEHVSLIPVRGGNGALEELARRGEWTPPALAELEEAVDEALHLAGDRAVVAADLWDLEGLSTCAGCFEARRRRLERLGLEGLGTNGVAEPRVACTECGGT